MSKQQTIETFITFFGKERLQRFEQIMNTTVDYLFDSVKRGERIKCLVRFYKRYKSVSDDIDTLQDLLALILLESCLEDIELYCVLLMGNPVAHMCLHYLADEAVMKLGEKLARYYEEKLGFPKNSLAYRYNPFVPISSYGDIIDVLGRYEFALCLESEVKKGDWVGDWLVIRKMGNYRISMLYLGKKGWAWDFEDPYLCWASSRDCSSDDDTRGKPLFMEKPDFILPDASKKYVGIFEGCTWLLSQNNMDEILHHLDKVKESDAEVVQIG